MIRLTARCVVVSLHNRTQSIPRRLLSLFEVRSSFGNVLENPAMLHHRCTSTKTLKKTLEEGEDGVKKPVRRYKLRDEMNKTETESSPIKEDNLDLLREISNGDEDVFNDLRSLQMKIDMLSKLYGVNMNMKRDHWNTLIKSSMRQRKKYIAYLLRIALKNLPKEKPLYDLELFNNEETNLTYDDPMCYHLFHNSMFLKFRQASLRWLAYSRVMTSVLHSPEIFIDCSYDQYMSDVESKNLCRQIVDAMRINFDSQDPYHIVLCNYNKNSQIGRSMSKYSGLFYENYFPITLSSKSYTNFYPKDRLVYLTPHCNNVLRELDPHKRYIIGGFVDKATTQPISLAKAKENQIQVAKFPLEKYLDWQKGKKSLCVNHVFSIMLTLKNSNNDWEEALKIIPRRCLTKEPIKKRSSNIFNSIEFVFACGGDISIDSSPEEFEDEN